jgi:hypothetical protein
MDDLNVNDEERYLASARMRAGKKMGEKKGKSVPQNYGDDKGEDNQIYSSRGMQTEDEKKLARQSMPNDRMYSYLQ